MATMNTTPRASRRAMLTALTTTTEATAGTDPHPAWQERWRIVDDTFLSYQSRSDEPAPAHILAAEDERKELMRLIATTPPRTPAGASPSFA